MLSARRAVLVKSIEKISLKRDRESMIDYVSHPVPETILVLAGEKGPGDPFNRGLIAAGAEPAMFWIPYENQTRQWIQIQFKDHGKVCSPPAAEALYERCGGGRGEKISLSTIAPEIEKIALSMGDRDRVTEDDLEVVARKAHEKLRDQMISRVTEKDAVGALQALDGALLFRENHEVRLVAILAHRLVAIATVRDWMRTGGERPGVWPWDEVRPAASRFSDREVARALEALASADRTLKSSPKNSRAVLEHTILTICK
jgi:DNA polymerase III delta subunit